MTKKINLPCDGDGGKKSIKKEVATIRFETSGSCQFTSVDFTGGSGSPYDPPGFSDKEPSNGAGKSVSYKYDGTPIPESGYTFEYMTDSSPKLGNGSGTIKND